MCQSVFTLSYLQQINFIHLSGIIEAIYEYIIYSYV